MTLPFERPDGADPDEFPRAYPILHCGVDGEELMRNDPEVGRGTCPECLRVYNSYTGDLMWAPS